jgi:TonB-linked SusC/RagA family outer membrane protein
MKNKFSNLLEWILFVLFWSFSQFIIAQDITVAGVVKDAKGEPLIGVTIQVSGTTHGTVTDLDGRFNLLNVPPDAILEITYIGMEGQKIPINGKTFIDVVLLEETELLDEVVVVGYGVQKKETLVGAVSQIDNKAIIQSGTSSVSNAIAGKLSGVLTMQQSGEPGNDDAEIIIRGLSSWNGSSPLALVDGVERDFKDLDPNEIETFSVLKDASATAVFGAKGADGVIIVTTKRGREGKPVLNISASTGMEKATHIPDHIDSYTTMNLLNVARMNEQQFTELVPRHVLDEYRQPSSPLNALRYPNVNWFDLVTRPFAPSTNANINVTGGTSLVKYFASLGYTGQGSFFEGKKEGHFDSRFTNDRFNYRTNLDFDLSKSTSLSFNIGGEVGIKNQPTIGTLWWTLYGTSPARFPAYFPEWLLEEYPDPNYPNDRGVRYAEAIGEYTNNPYTVFNQRAFNRYLETKLFTDAMFKQKLDSWIKGLYVQGKVSLSTYYRNLSLTAGETNNYPEYQFDYDKALTGQNPWIRKGETEAVYNMPPLSLNIGGLQGGYYRDLYYEFSANYANTFGLHSVSALALMNFQQKNEEIEFPYYNQGVVGRVTYDYANKYLAEVNVGYTGSERFAPTNRYGFFPSGAVGWLVSEEEFFKNIFPWFNKLKIRYSDGLVGSDKAANRWLYISDYITDSRGHIREDKAANNRAQWEEARKQDLGMDMGFLNNKIHLAVDLFQEHRTNMLLTPQSVPWLLGIQFKDLNLGEMKKHGLEIEAEFRNTTATGVYYFVKGLMGANENRIVFKDDPPYAPDYQKMAGKPLGGQTSGVQLAGSGYFTSVDDIHILPSPLAVSGLNVGDYSFIDYNADGTVSNLDAYPIRGSLYPPVTYSFSSGFSYKNFDFSFLFQGNIGKYVEYNQNFEAEFTKGNFQVHASQLDYWTPTNPNANHSTLHYPGTGYIRNLAWLPAVEATGYTTYIEGRFWRRADYLKLKEVYAGYSFSPKWQILQGISLINLYMTANNLLTFTDLIEGDPERKDFSKGYYPQLLSVKLGAKISF